jgi:hypothetical protein
VSVVGLVLHENVGVMRLLDHVGVFISMRTRREVSEVIFVHEDEGNNAIDADVACS